MDWIKIWMAVQIMAVRKTRGSDDRKVVHQTVRVWWCTHTREHFNSPTHHYQSEYNYLNNTIIAMPVLKKVRSVAKENNRRQFNKVRGNLCTYCVTWYQGMLQQHWIKQKMMMAISTTNRETVPPQQDLCTMSILFLSDVLLLISCIFYFTVAQVYGLLCVMC